MKESLLTIPKNEMTVLASASKTNVLSTNAVSGNLTAVGEMLGN